MILFPDQAELVEKVRAEMRLSKSVLMVSPTGSGKTQMAVDMIRAAKNKNRKILFSVPRRDLMEQTSETFNRLGIPHSFVAAGKIFNPHANIYIGMVDTMARRLDKLPKVDLLIPDETHFGEGSLGAIINHYKNAGSWVLGLSATPWKLSGKGLGCWYDRMVVGKSIRWLIDNKRLSDYRYFYGKTKPDLSGIKIAGGDYAKGELAGYMEEQKAIIGDCVSDYRERCMGRIHVVRCASIKHSQITAQAFRDAGIPAMHIDGETPMEERKQIFRSLARRELLVATFCSLLNFGFDLSQASGGLDVCIESGSDQKPTKSLADLMQFRGRVLRMKEHGAIFNDHVNNYLEHGFPDDEIEWTLEDRSQGKRASEERAIATKQCDKCFFVHRPAPSCPNCGATYEVKSREIERVDGTMHEMTREERESFKRERTEVRKAEEKAAAKLGLDALIELGISRNYEHPEAWAARQISIRNAYKRR